MGMNQKTGWLLNLGRIDYDEGLKLQAELEEKRKEKLIPDILVLLEHDPVYTLGRSTDPGNLLLDKEDLEKRGVKRAMLSRMRATQAAGIPRSSRV